MWSKGKVTGGEETFAEMAPSTNRKRYRDQSVSTNKVIMIDAIKLTDPKST
jgi:hypothetical protein